MTTYIQMTPLPFSFQATLDGAPYNVVATWNVSAQRLYMTVYDQTNTVIVSAPIIGSPPGSDINLVGGYFSKSTLVFRAATNQFEVNP